MKPANRGCLIWVTGLPGAGKTTLAKEIYEKINKEHPSVLMDGDSFRQILGNDLGYSMEDRLKNAFRLAKMNKYLIDHGLAVVCATVSLFKEIHEWNRKNIENVCEVFVEVPLEVLIARDQKKLYSTCKKGEANDIIGFDQPYEKPKNPDFTIINDGSKARFLKQADQIARYALKRFFATVN